MTRQLVFDLPMRVARGREDFFVSPANAAAVAAVEAWRDWPQAKLVLAGPEGAGKTHLVHVWAALSGAEVVAAEDVTTADVAVLARHPALAIEDVDRISGGPQETALFHLHNHVLAEGGRLLFTGTGAPSGWGIALPDLRTRIEGTQAVLLGPPDDALLARVLEKLFADRQLVHPPALIPYLLPRMQRSFAAAGRLVSALDAAALAERRALSVALAGKVLTALDDPAGDLS